MKKVIIGLITVALALVAGFYYGYPTEEETFKGVNIANEYKYKQLTGPIATTSAISTQAGALGSVIVTETQAGAMVIWDATSTEAVGNTYATRVADIKSAIAEGTYTFDTSLRYGLVYVSDDGFSFAGDWTITYR